MRGYPGKIVSAIAVLTILMLTATMNVEAKEVFPSRPISIIVGFPPGGSVDIGIRGLAPYMGQYLKTSVVISNTPGAGGKISYVKGYTAKPDGYTLLFWNTLAPLLEEYRQNVGYKTLGFTPIAGIARDLPILVGHPDSSKSAADFVKQARTQTVSIGSNGQFTIAGLLVRLMAQELGLKVNWVNYGGAAESLTALAGKHIDAVATFTDSAVPLIKAGKISPLLIFAKNRSHNFPTVPVPGELGYNFPLIGSYLGIVGPPGLDKEKVKILQDAVMKAAKHPDYVAWRDKASTSEPALISAEAYRIEIARFAKVAEDNKGVLTSK